MSCKPMGRPRLDKAVGTETAGRPGVKKKTAEGQFRERQSLDLKVS